MIFGDLKRAIEDTILKPETNRLSDISKRSTIAALDLVQVDQRNTTSVEDESYLDSVGTLCSHDATLNLAESGYTTCSTASDGIAQVAPSFSSSNSLDTVVLRQSISSRPSLGTSRRSSRVLPHYSQSKRKRSNSVSSCLTKNRQGRQGSSSNMGISSTSAGGASALSLPPTARQTPFRFGESEDRFYFHSNSSEGPSPVFQFPSHETVTAGETCDVHSQLGSGTGKQNQGAFNANDEWTVASNVSDGVVHNDDATRPCFRKYESENLLRSAKPASEHSDSVFNDFRQQREDDDSDECDEEMDCD